MLHISESETEENNKEYNLFQFLTIIFENIYFRLNLPLEAPSPILATQNRIPCSQSEAIIKDFRLIVSLNCIDEHLFLKWFQQYERQWFVRLSIFYWYHLMKDNNIECNFILKTIQVIYIQFIANSHKNSKDDPDFQESENRCEYSYNTIISEIKKLEKRQQKNYLDNSVIKKQIHLLYLEMNLGNYRAHYYLGLVFNLFIYQKKMISLSFLNFFKAYYYGDIDSIGHLGFIYYVGGEFIPRDFKIAARFFNEASNRGCHEGSFYLGVMYLGGFGVEKCLRTAMRYWFLGSFYDHLKCIDELKHHVCLSDIDYFKNMIQQGNYISCRSLGIIYYHGIILDKNKEKGVDYWFLGLENECTECQKQLKFYFEKNHQHIIIYKNLAKSFGNKFSKRWFYLLKYNLIPIKYL